MTEEHYRKSLPDTRRSRTHKFKIFDERGGETSIFLTVGYYDDGFAGGGKLGEMFINVGKQGSTLKGALDSFAIMGSLALQYGVPLEAITRKFRHVAFEPSGKTSNEEIPTCSSIVDYMAQWLEMNQEIESDYEAPEPPA